jgi:hypothetical protein
MLCSCTWRIVLEDKGALVPLLHFEPVLQPGINAIGLHVGWLLKLMVGIWV